MRLGFDVAAVDFGSLESWRPVSSLLARAKRDPGIGQHIHATGRDSGHPTEWAFLRREAIVKALEATNPGMVRPPLDGIYVIGGQQAGLLTGPLYTFLKAVTCVGLARRLRPSTGAEVLPLFWVASEDHDVLEVNRVTVNGQRFVVPYGGDVKRGVVPQVADIPIHEARAPLLEFLENCLPRTDFTAWVLEMVAGLDYSSYATAFCSMMHVLLGSWGLRVADPIALRHLTSPVLASLVERWPDLERALERGSQSIAAAGVEPPISGLRLFEISGGCRVPVERTRDGLRLSSGTCSFEETADHIRREPQRFSPGAALRPLLQDAVLPTAVTVAGPTELAYLLQITPLYEIAGLTPSPRYPRISATFLEAREQRAARKIGLSPARIFETLGLLEQPAKIARDASAEAIARKGRELLALVDELPHSPQPRWLRSSRAGIDAAVSRILRRLQQERLDDLGVTQERLRRIADAILPGGSLQERVANVTQFLNLHGPDFVRCAVEELDPHTLAHQVVAIGLVNGD